MEVARETEYQQQKQALLPYKSGNENKYIGNSDQPRILEANSYEFIADEESDEINVGMNDGWKKNKKVSATAKFANFMSDRKEFCDYLTNANLSTNEKKMLAESLEKLELVKNGQFKTHKNRKQKEKVFGDSFLDGAVPLHYTDY